MYVMCRVWVVGVGEGGVWWVGGRRGVFFEGVCEGQGGMQAASTPSCMTHAKNRCVDTNRSTGDMQLTHCSTRCLCVNCSWIALSLTHSITHLLPPTSPRSLREEMYKAYIGRASAGEMDNTPIIDQVGGGSDQRRHTATFP